jgi:hypothetical protein
VQTKDQVASALAQAHYRIESSIRHIVRVRNATQEGDSAEPIKLLEVNDATIPSGILPVYFGPHESLGYTFPSIIIDVTPDEYDQLRACELTLPNGWEVGEEMARSDAAVQTFPAPTGITRCSC